MIGAAQGGGGVGEGGERGAVEDVAGRAGQAQLDEATVVVGDERDRRR